MMNPREISLAQYRNGPVVPSSGGLHFLFISDAHPKDNAMTLEAEFKEFGLGPCKAFKRVGSSTARIGFFTSQDLQAAVDVLIDHDPFGYDYSVDEAEIFESPMENRAMRAGYYSDRYGGPPYNYGGPMVGTPPFMRSPQQSEMGSDDGANGLEVGPCGLGKCGKMTSFSCHFCGTFYCSVTCQKEDWPLHKPVCYNGMPNLNYGRRHVLNHGHLDGTDVVERLGKERENGLGDQHQRPREKRDGGFSGQHRREGHDGGFSGRHPREQRDGGFGGRRPREQRDGGFGDQHPREERDGSFGGRRPREQRDGGFGDQRPREERDGGFGGRRPGEQRDGGFGDQHPRKERDGGFGGRRPRDQRDGEFSDRRENQSSTGNRRFDGQRGGNSFGDRRPFDGPRGSKAGNDRRHNGNFQRNENSDRCPLQREDVGERSEAPSFAGKSSGSQGNNQGIKTEVTRSSPNVEAPVSAEKPKYLDLGQQNATNTVAFASTSQASALVHGTVKQTLHAELGTCITLKDNDTVTVSGADTTDCIYVTPTSGNFSEEYLKMFLELAKHCETVRWLGREPKQGEFVACEYDKDKEFYRGVVEEILPNKQYSVRFLDFGNVQKSSASQLKALPDSLKICPRNAVKVFLRDVESLPLSGTLRQLLDGLPDTEERFNIRFDGSLENGVELIRRNGESLNETIRSLCKDFGERSETPSFAGKSSGSQGDYQGSRTEVVRSSPKVEAPVSSEKPKHLDLDERNVSNMAAFASTSQASALVSDPVKQTLHAEVGTCITLKDNDTVIVIIANSTDCIYVGPPKENHSAEYLKMSDELKKHCESAPWLGREPKEGEFVACKFQLDQKFYRGVVEEVLPNKQYAVLFCDYGNVQKSSANELKALPDSLKVCPWNAVKVFLRDVKSVPISGTLLHLMSDLTDNEEHVRIRFDGSLENGVELIRPNGESVNERIRNVSKDAHI